MNTPQLLFIDPQHERHYVTLLRRCQITPGMYVCEREDGSLVTVHASALLVVPTPQDLDQILDGDSVPIRHVAVGSTTKKLIAVWKEWRNDAPNFGQSIFVSREKENRCEQGPVQIHSAAEVASYMERGWTHWRYC